MCFQKLIANTVGPVPITIIKILYSFLELHNIKMDLISYAATSGININQLMKANTERSYVIVHLIFYIHTLCTHVTNGALFKTCYFILGLQIFVLIVLAARSTQAQHVLSAVSRSSLILSSSVSVHVIGMRLQSLRQINLFKFLQHRNRIQRDNQNLVLK